MDPVDGFLNELEYQKQVQPNATATAALQWAHDQIAELRAKVRYYELGWDDEHQKQKAEIERLRAALKPFAQEAEHWNDPPGVLTYDNVQLWQDPNYRCALTVGDLRLARKALSSGKGSGE